MAPDLLGKSLMTFSLPLKDERQLLEIHLPIGSDVFV